MKQISNKEYEKYQQYQTDKLHGRILTPDGSALSAPVWIMILRRSASTCWRCWPSSGMKESLIKPEKRTQPTVELSIYRYFH